jgi:hypothetical protein
MNSLLKTYKTHILHHTYFNLISRLLPPYLLLTVHVDDLDPEGNLRPLDAAFADTLANTIESVGGYNSEFTLKVMGPYDADPARGFSRPYYKIKNGQHRYSAMQTIWRKHPPLERTTMTLPCAVYPTNLEDYQIRMVSVNIEQAAKVDTVQQRYSHILSLLDQENVNSRKFTKPVYVSMIGKEPQGSNNWVDQLKKAFKYPRSSSFTTDRFVQDSVPGDAGLSMVSTSRVGDSKLLFEYPYFHTFNERALNQCGMNIETLVRELILHPLSITKDSYNSLYNFSRQFVSLSPFDVEPILRRYVESLRALTESEDSDDQKGRAAKKMNTELNAYAKAIPQFIKYLENELPQKPTLPQQYMVEGLTNIQDVTSAELFHMFQLTLNPSSRAIVQKILRGSPLKEQENYLKTQFESNIAKHILSAWKLLFQVVPVARPVLSSSWVVFEADGCTFNNCCAFDWIAEQEGKKQHFNLVLGDIPVSFILYVWFT